MYRRRLAVLVLVLATLLVAFGIYPIPVLEMLLHARLGHEGVRSRHLGALHAYERDACRGKEPCACVALVHGLADSSLTWLAQLEKIDWRVPLRLFAVDLPGSGRSPAPARPEQYRVRLQAETLRAALATECPRWIVAGNSLGGWIAAWLALDWPQGVSGLILVDSAGLRLAEDIGRLFVNPTRESMERFQKAAFAKPLHYPDFLWRAAVERIAGGSAPVVVRAQDPRDLLPEHLAAIRARTIVLWGALDRVFPPADGQRFAHGIRGADYLEAPACGHVPQKECPSSVNDAIERLANQK